MVIQRSVVKWFDAKKGYGFIVNPQGGPDIFVHYSQIDTERRFKTLRTGQVIEYELHDGDKGPHAQNVTFLESDLDRHGVEEGPQAVPVSSNNTEPAPEQPFYSQL